MNTLRLYDTAIAYGVPRADPRYLAGLKLFDENGTFVKYGLTTPLRVAHFLAQVLHESGRFTVVREDMRYRAARIMEIFGVGKHSAAVTWEEAKKLVGKPDLLAERVYGLGNPTMARNLGNTHPGDGARYIGNGPGQTTGRAAHRELGIKVGLGNIFEENPDLVMAPEYVFLLILAEWEAFGGNKLADANNIKTITKRLNGGYNGYADRVAIFNSLWKMLNTSDAPASWQHAEEDPDVLKLQQDLNVLGATPRLTEDGRFGPATERAVRAFQKSNNLKVDGIAGDATKAAIALRINTVRKAPLIETKAESTDLVEKVGSSTAVFGFVGDKIMANVEQAKALVTDSPYLTVGLNVLMVIGVALVAYGLYVKYIREKTPITE